jgi:hypothetical protein
MKVLRLTNHVGRWRFRLRFILSFAVAIIVAGCDDGNGGGGAGVDAQDIVATDTVADEDADVDADVDADEDADEDTSELDWIEDEGATIDIPDGVLAPNDTLSIHISDAELPALPAGYEPASPFWAFLPHGQTFTSAVTIGLALDEGVVVDEDETLTIFRLDDDDDSTWEAVEEVSPSSEGWVSFETDRFSYYVVGQRLTPTLIAEDTSTGDFVPLAIADDGDRVFYLQEVTVDLNNTVTWGTLKIWDRGQIETVDEAVVEGTLVVGDDAGDRYIYVADVDTNGAALTFRQGELWYQQPTGASLIEEHALIDAIIPAPGGQRVAVYHDRGPLDDFFDMSIWDFDSGSLQTVIANPTDPYDSARRVGREAPWSRWSDDGEEFYYFQDVYMGPSELSIWRADGLHGSLGPVYTDHIAFSSHLPLNPLPDNAPRRPASFLFFDGIETGGTPSFDHRRLYNPIGRDVATAAVPYLSNQRPVLTPYRRFSQLLAPSGGAFLFLSNCDTASTPPTCNLRLHEVDNDTSRTVATGQIDGALLLDEQIYAWLQLDPETTGDVDLHIVNEITGTTHVVEDVEYSQSLLAGAQSQTVLYKNEAGDAMWASTTSQEIGSLPFEHPLDGFTSYPPRDLAGAIYVRDIDPNDHNRRNLHRYEFGADSEIVLSADTNRRFQRLWRLGPQGRYLFLIRNADADPNMQDLVIRDTSTGAQVVYPAVAGLNAGQSGNEVTLNLQNLVVGHGHCVIVASEHSDSRLYRFALP